MAVIRGNATSVIFTTAGEDHCPDVGYASRAKKIPSQQEQCHELKEAEEEVEESSLALAASESLLDMLNLDGPLSQVDSQIKGSRPAVSTLKEYRALYEEMKAGVADSEYRDVIQDRDVMADPDLARYLGRPSGLSV